MLHARSVVVVEILLNLRLFLVFGRFIDRELYFAVAILHHLGHQRGVLGRDVLVIEVLEELEAELLIMVKGFDDSFSQHVITRSSYKHDEIDWDVEFVRAYSTEGTGETIVDLEKVSETERIN